MVQAQCLTVGSIETDIDGNCLIYGTPAGQVCKFDQDAQVKAQEIYICATEENRALKVEIEHLKSQIAGARIRVVHPEEDGYCGDGKNPGLEIEWPHAG